MAEKEITATNPTTGERVVLRNGQWVPLETAAPRALPGRPTEAASAQDRDIRQGMRQGFGAFLANALSVPHGAGKLLAGAAALPALVPGGKSFSEAREEQEKILPARLLLSIPDVSTEEVLAVPSAVAKSLSDPMVHRRRLAGTRFNEAVAEEEQKATENPIASSAGRTAADVSTLLTLRPGERVTRAIGLNPRAAIPETGATRALLTRGLGRAVEAGADGATIAALGDADPVTTAAYTAGIQAGGSASLAAKGWVFRNPIKSFLGITLGHEIWKAVAPGPQEIFSSKDSAVNEMVGAYVAGLTAAALGSGRGVGQGNVRAITDMLSTGARSTVASVVTQLQEAANNGNDTPARVLELMSSNPDHFGADVRQRIEQAAASDKPRALLNEIDQLMQSERFRKALEEQSEEAPAPSRSFADFLMRR